MAHTEHDHVLHDEQAYRDAMERAGRLLGVRARSTHELEERLAAAGFALDVIARVVLQLTGMGLLDDRAFARSWIERRSARGRGPHVLLAELEAKGIDPDVAHDAVAATQPDEHGRAQAAAAEYSARVAGLPLAGQARRIFAHLARRGFSSDACEAAVKAVLPPEDWD